MRLRVAALQVALVCPVLLLLGEPAPAGAGGQAEEETPAVQPAPQRSELDAEVTLPSRKAERISSSPAIVSVITGDEIRRLGARNLYEALRFVPGIDLTETFFGYTSVSFRGLLQTHYNNRSLLLLDGHPLFETYTGSYYLEQVPLSAVDRIEIIRGPGSTLYGADAWAGVINVVTRSGEDLAGGELRLAGGSFGTMFPSLAAGRGGKVAWKVAASGQWSDGYDYDVLRDEDGKSGTVDYESDQANVLASVEYQGLTLSGGHFQLDKSKFGLTPTLVSSAPRTVTGTFADLRYRRDLTSKLSLSGMAFYDAFDREENVGYYPPTAAAKAAGLGQPGVIDYNGGHRMGLDLHGDYAFTGTTSLLVGFLHDAQHSGRAPFVSDVTGLEVPSATSIGTAHDASDTAGYAQVDTSLWGKVGLVGGLRFNHNSDYGSSLAPRVGVVYQASDKLSLKALYGNAFRNPNFFEKYVETQNVLFGDPKLDPEKIDTFDLGLDYMPGDLHNLRLNFFYLRSDDLVVRSRTIPAGTLGNTRPTPQYGNGAGQRLYGVEAEWRGWIRPSVFHFLNASLARGEERSDDSELAFVPQFVANLGVNWKPVPRLTISPYVHHVGSKQGNLSDAAKTPVEVDSYTIVNLVAILAVGEKLELGLSLEDLLGQTYAYPEYVRRVVPSTPGGPGRAAFASLTYRLGF